MAAEASEASTGRGQPGRGQPGRGKKVATPPPGFENKFSGLRLDDNEEILSGKGRGKGKASKNHWNSYCD